MISQADFGRLVAEGEIDDEDVLALRRVMFGDDYRISAEEAAAIFALNDACEGTSNAWAIFFVESITDYVVQSEPEGYMSQANADWLMTRVSQSGVVKTGTELELLLKVMEDVCRRADAAGTTCEAVGIATCCGAVVSSASWP